MSIAEFAFDFAEQGLNARFVRYVRWLRDEGDVLINLDDLVRSQLESFGTSSDEDDACGACLRPGSSDSLDGRVKLST